MLALMPSFMSSIYTVFKWHDILWNFIIHFNWRMVTNNRGRESMIGNEIWKYTFDEGQHSNIRRHIITRINDC